MGEETKRVYGTHMIEACCLGMVVGFQEIEFWNLYIRVGSLDVGDHGKEFIEQVYQMVIELFPRQGVHFLEGFIQWPDVFIAPPG